MKVLFVPELPFPCPAGLCGMWKFIVAPERGLILCATGVENHSDFVGLEVPGENHPLYEGDLRGGGVFHMEEEEIVVPSEQRSRRFGYTETKDKKLLYEILRERGFRISIREDWTP